MTTGNGVWIILGSIILMRLLQKPAYRAIWGAYTGPKFYAAVTDVIKRNDPSEIAYLRKKYNSWPTDTQEQFRDTLRKLNLRRPW